MAVDSDGKLVVIELKRDDTGADAHWQAIKYASYFQRATADDIVVMAAAYWSESQDAAITQLLQHLGTDDLNALNNGQRIILASHRFAPEVTSAALWLNQKVANEDLLTCIKLTPYQDTQKDTLYVQASTIIPVPGVDDYLVRVAHGSERDLRESRSSLGAKLTATFARNKNDLNQYQGGMCISGRLTMTARTPRHLISPSGPNWVGTDSAVLRYVHFTLALV